MAYEIDGQAARGAIRTEATALFAFVVAGKITPRAIGSGIVASATKMKRSEAPVNVTELDWLTASATDCHEPTAARLSEKKYQRS